jgi:hypothetical protein
MAAGCDEYPGQVFENKTVLVLGKSYDPLADAIGIPLGSATRKSFVYWDHWDE